MPTLAQRLRELDRKVGREDQLRTPEGYRRSMSRWWVPLAFAAILALLGLMLATILNTPAAAYGLPFPLLVLSFQAGRMKTEHDRLTGHDPWSRVRPPGL